MHGYRLPGGSDLFNPPKWPVRAKPDDYLPLKRAAAMLGADPDVVQKLIDTDVVDSYVDDDVPEAEQAPLIKGSDLTDLASTFERVELVPAAEPEAPSTPSSTVAPPPAPVAADVPAPAPASASADRPAASNPTMRLVRPAASNPADDAHAPATCPACHGEMLWPHTVRAAACPRCGVGLEADDTDSRPVVPNPVAIVPAAKAAAAVAGRVAPVARSGRVLRLLPFVR